MNRSICTIHNQRYSALTPRLSAFSLTGAFSSGESSISAGAGFSW